MTALRRPRPLRLIRPQARRRRRLALRKLLLLLHGQILRCLHAVVTGLPSVGADISLILGLPVHAWGGGTDSVVGVGLRVAGVHFEGVGGAHGDAGAVELLL